MNFYERHILPHIITCACGQGPIMKERAKIVPEAYGVVLEIGAGSGLNFPLYDPAKVTKLYALEPSPEIRRLAAKREAGLKFPIEWLDLPGERIPLADASVDTVVSTFTLCTIPDAVAALEGMKRVLKPGGKFLFLEHGRSPEPGVAKWQDRLTPAWKKIGGGCHLNREIDTLVSGAGFKIETLDRHYAEGPRFATYLYGGAAV